MKLRQPRGWTRDDVVRLENAAVVIVLVVVVHVEGQARQYLHRLSAIARPKAAGFSAKPLLSQVSSI